MKIKINNKYGIKSDNYQYMLCELYEEENDEGKTEEKFRPLRYYPKLRQLFENYVDFRLKTEPNITELNEVIELEKELRKEIGDIKRKLDI